MKSLHHRTLSIAPAEGVPVIRCRLGLPDGSSPPSRRVPETEYTEIADNEPAPVVDDRPKLDPGRHEGRRFHRAVGRSGGHEIRRPGEQRPHPRHIVAHPRSTGLRAGPSFGRSAGPQATRWWWLWWCGLCWCLLTGQAAGQQFGDFHYHGNNTFITITGYTGAGGAVTIPDTIAGRPVQEIWLRAFTANTTLSSVIIPDGVTSIGYSAFEACTGLTSVTIPDSVTNIGDWAFKGCTSLTSVRISESVRSIGSGVFSDCTGLTDVSIPESVASIGGGAFKGCTGLTDVSIPESVASIGDGAFKGCTGLTHVRIAESVLDIGSGAFTGCASLLGIEVAAGNSVYRSVDGVLFDIGLSVLIAYPGGKTGSYVIPGSVTRVEWAAFADCTGLASVTIGHGVTGIERSLFAGCTALESVTIGHGPTTIEEYSFLDSTRLREITVDAGNPAFSSVDGVLFDRERTALLLHPQGKPGAYTIPVGVTAIGPGAFYGCTGLTGVTIPASVTAIGSGAFSGCMELTRVTIPGGVTGIGWFAFDGCTSLAEVTIGNGVTVIGGQAFSGCTSLTGVTIPDSVTHIGSSAFSRCTSLADLIIGNGVTVIENWAFSGCTSLTGVTIPDSVTSIEWNAFAGCTSLTGVTIGEGATNIEGVFSGCTSLLEIAVSAGNPIFSSVDGVLFNKDRTALLLHPWGKTGGYTIPASVTTIGREAFYGCTGLTYVTIPAGVTSIGSWAFLDCTGLTGVTIGHGVATIGSSAFGGCTGLTGVTIPASVTRLGDEAFSGCANLVSVLFLAAAPATSGEDPPFSEVASGFTVYYFEGSSGFTSPRWLRYRAVALTPFDPADDTPKVLAIASADPGRFALVTFGKADRTYQLQCRADLAGTAPWSAVTTTEPLTTDRVLELTDPAAPAGQAFYRVVAVGP